MTIDRLDQCSAADITSLPRDVLSDIRSVELDGLNSLEARVRKYLEQIENPYCFLCDNIPVKITFSGGEHTLRDRLTRYFASGKRA